MSDNIALDDDNHLKTSDGKLIKFHTPAFLRWLEENKSFRFEAGEGGENSYRARKETIKGADYWYAVKKVNGKLHKRFIGKSSDVTHHKLVEVSKLIRQPAKSKSDSEHYQPTPNITQPTPNITQPSDNNEVTQRLTNLESLVSQLQKQVEELTKKLNNSDDNAVVSSELENLQKQNEQLADENSRLTEQVGLLTNQLTNQVDNTLVNQVSQLDYITIRNRVVSQWKVAKRAETRERIALAIDKFIEELEKADK